MGLRTVRVGNSLVFEFDTVKEGAFMLGSSAPSGRQTLEARIKDPELFKIWLDSRDVHLYGGMGSHHRYRLKMDFDFTQVFGAYGDPDSPVLISEKRYNRSNGTAFVIIPKLELEGTAYDWAIEARKYRDFVRDGLDVARAAGKGFSVDDLIKAGGCKINTGLAVDEHIRLTRGRDVLKLSEEEIAMLSLPDFGYIHACWLKHFTGYNEATPQQYLEGARLYARYLQEAVKNQCFTERRGMGFSVGVLNREYMLAKDYRVCNWYVQNKDGKSGAADWKSPSDFGHFLSVSRLPILDQAKLFWKERVYAMMRFHDDQRYSPHGKDR